MYETELALAPEPERIAALLWHEPDAVVLWTADGSGPSYVACDAIERRSALDPEPELPLAGALADPRMLVPRWIGVLPYEAERSRLERPRYTTAETRPAPHHEVPEWWRYAAICVVDKTVRVVGDDRLAVRRLASKLLSGAAKGGALSCGRPLLRGPTLRDSQVAAAGHARATGELELDIERHRARIQRALAHIYEGDIYEVNMARRLTFPVKESLLSVLVAMTELTRPPYGAALSAAGVVSTSPELFLQLEPGGRVLTVPIKGTRPRSADKRVDARLKRELELSPKEAAELAMVVDIERSDLCRVSEVGRVHAEPAYIHTHPTLFHRQARVSAQLRPEVGRAELLRVMLPSGSITGAPKIRAMELIRELEEHRRGLYTGALGFIQHAGGMTLAMAIRTLTVREGCGHYFVGGGIVAASDVEAEILETHWKAVQVVRALDIRS